MNISITNQQTGEKLQITRSVSATHPAWVHSQCGTSSESELQSCLDQYDVSDYYRDGKHLGPDSSGVELTDDRLPTVRMTEEQAREYIAEHDDSDDLDADDLEHAFAAIFGRRASDWDRAEGLWSILCTAKEAQ